MNAFKGLDDEGKQLDSLFVLGQIYLIIFILINVILMLNFVIAILSATFARYDDIKLGLYYNVLNELFPSMSWDNEYGGLICGSKPPFNIIVLPFIPFYWCCSSATKKKITKISTFLMYLPVSVIVSLFFFALNAIMAPIAYCYHVFRLISNFLTSNSLMQLPVNLLVFLKFTILGPIMFTVALFVNSGVFTYNLFTNQEETDQEHPEVGLTKRSLDIFEMSLLELIEKQKVKVLEAKATGKATNDLITEDGEYLIEFVELNILLQQKFEIIREIMKIIYDHTDEDKFIKHPETNKLILAPSWLAKINEFNILKNLVFNSTNEQTKLINLNMMLSFVEQVKQKQKMYESNSKHRFVTDFRTKEEIIQDNLYELKVMKPIKIEQSLHEEQTLIEHTDQKVDKVLEMLLTIQMDVGKLKKNMMEKESEGFNTDD